MVVGDVHRGDFELPEKTFQIDAVLLAQRLIKIGERLIDQEDRGITGNTAPQSDALFFTTRQRGRLAVKQIGKLDPHQRAGALELGPGERVKDGCLLAEEEVGPDIRAGDQVWIERVVLKDHADPALAWVYVLHIHVIEEHGTRVRLQKPCDEFQQGCLAAAARPQHDHRLAVGHPQGQVTDRDRRPRPATPNPGRLAQRLADVPQIDLCHSHSSASPARRAGT